MKHKKGAICAAIIIPLALIGLFTDSTEETTVQTTETIESSITEIYIENSADQATEIVTSEKKNFNYNKKSNYYN